MRRDLRLGDNRALLEAATASERVVCAFVLDPALLRGPRAGPPIVAAFFDALGALREDLRTAGSDLALLEGDPSATLTALAERTGARAVFFNADVEPDAIVRDARVARALEARGIEVRSFTDQVYFGAGEVLTADGGAYTVYTPYRRRWTARFEVSPNPPLASRRALRGKLLGREAVGPTRDVPRPEDYGHPSSAAYPRAGERRARELLTAFLRDGIAAYANRRNIPAVDGTSHLSPQLRAGTIGIRTAVHAAARARAEGDPAAATGAGVWLGELIWRDFYQQLLAHHPRIATGPFVEAARRIPYADDPGGFAAWCEGRTGYPIVDAAMVQLNTTGWMHNRLRMIVASFLTKHLLIGYRHGERYFEQRLADADLAANNGGWQWAGSTGTDAAPYFRVFNPVLQGKTFDPDGTFVRAMLPALAKLPARYVHEPWTVPPLLQAELGCTIGVDYPAPIVDHAMARARAIAVYGAALSSRQPSRP